MDITITDNPYQEGIIINPNIEHKVAKLKNDTKRITIENYYNVELAKMKMGSNTVKDTVSKEHGNDLVMGRLGIESLDYYAYCDSLKGARKLKVGKENVFNNVKRYYEKQNRNMIDNLPVENKKEELPKEEVVNVADNNEVSFTPHIVDTPLSDTRMSRLERTGEIPKVEEKAEVTLKREDINHGRVNDIINAPDRFVEPEREVKEEVVNPYEALINDTKEENKEKNINSELDKKETVEIKGGDPNLYNKLIHGEDDSNIYTKLQDAQNKLSTFKEEKERARVVNANLEAEREKLLEEVEKIKKSRQEQAQKELDNTLSQIQSAKEEILSETRKYDNLQDEIALLMKEKERLLNSNNSYYDEENYGRSRAA